MNDILPTPINEGRVTKVLAIILLLFCLLPSILNITCLTPLYFSLENNTIYRGTAITITLKYISDLFELISFGSAYAAIIFSLVLLKKKTTAFIAISFCALLLIKIPLRLLMNIPLYGTIGTKEEIIADLIALVFYLILEILQLALVFAFVAVCAGNYLRSVEMLTQKGKTSPHVKHILPIKKYVDWYNPLLRSAIYSSIIITVFKMVSRIITDIDAGAPSSFGEVMIMIVNYVADAAYGFAAYILAILIFNLLFEKLTKADDKDKKHNKNKADGDNPSALFED